MLGGLLFAGYDTTRNQLGLAMSLFCEHPDQWRLLAERPDLVPAAVEEVMRVAGTVAVVPRFATCDLDVDGCLIPAGTLVMLSLSAANHDPAVYRDPEAFEITAAREPQMGFGGGLHYCLGTSVARSEMQEALRLLAVALPEVALDGEPQWRSMTGIYEPVRLPLRFARESDAMA
jgi:cytochrome P450